MYKKLNASFRKMTLPIELTQIILSDEIERTNLQIRFLNKEICKWYDENVSLRIFIHAVLVKKSQYEYPLTIKSIRSNSRLVHRIQDWSRYLDPDFLCREPNVELIKNDPLLYWTMLSVYDRAKIYDYVPSSKIEYFIKSFIYFPKKTIKKYDIRIRQEEFVTNTFTEMAEIAWRVWHSLSTTKKEQILILVRCKGFAHFGSAKDLACIKYCHDIIFSDKKKAINVINANLHLICDVCEIGCACCFCFDRKKWAMIAN